MPSICVPALSEFAAHVIENLSRQQKVLWPRYFYDDLGSALFEAITLLPEYGLTRADERLLAQHSPCIIAATGPVSTIAELGSGSGKKSLHVLRAAYAQNHNLVYRPIDVSAAALAACEREVGELCATQTICDDWLAGLAGIQRTRSGTLPMILMFLGSSIGNLDRQGLAGFLRELRAHLLDGDFFLLGADLVKNVDVMLSAYDDPTGVTAAFNLNILGRMNRELGTNFDLKSFAHEVRWNESERRIEMHLRSRIKQRVTSGQLDAEFTFQAGETIWTESSHKFEESELEELALRTGFVPIKAWVDEEWPMTETLWKAA